MSLEKSTTSVDNPIVNELMKKFWESYHELYKEMDSITYEEFNKRSDEMWSWRNKAADYGDYFLITLWGMSEKAIKLWGKDGSERYFIDTTVTPNILKKQL